MRHQNPANSEQLAARDGRVCCVLASYDMLDCFILQYISGSRGQTLLRNVKGMIVDEDKSKDIQIDQVSREVVSQTFLYRAFVSGAKCGAVVAIVVYALKEIQII